jgi:hypothetical protein
MKYSIKKSRLDNVIDTFLTSQLGGLDKSLEKIYSTVNRDVYRDSNGNVIMIIMVGMNYKPEVAINQHVYQSFANLFGFNDYSEIQKYFIKWFKNHLGIDVRIVETFEHGQDEYFY